MGWKRIADDWLEGLFSETARPWPRRLVLMYLRYVDEQVRVGRRYWIPADAPMQIRLASERKEPIGRRALATVCGWKESSTKNLHAAVELWRDPHEEETESTYPGRTRPVPGSRQA